MKISFATILALTAVVSKAEILGGPINDKAKFPSGTDSTSLKDLTADPNAPGNTDPSKKTDAEIKAERAAAAKVAKAEAEAERKAAAAKAKADAEAEAAAKAAAEAAAAGKSCVKNERYNGRPTPCDGKRVNHVTIIDKGAWAYWYYYTYN
jgi:membrane protein involved in colicin uptake